MSLTIVLVLTAILLTAGSYLAVHYVVTLPYAPECPTCKCVTAQPVHPRRVDRLFAHVGGADVRQCPRCGWTGRMRWRLAAERVRRRS